MFMPFEGGCNRLAGPHKVIPIQQGLKLFCDPLNQPHKPGAAS